VKVSPDDIRFWENKNILPKGIRKSHKGAIRAIYPHWYVILIYRLRQMQQEGYSLAQIKRQLRAHASVLVGGSDDEIGERLRKQLAAAVPKNGLDWSEVKGVDDLVRIPGWNQAMSPQDINFDMFLEASIRLHAELLDRFTGERHVKATLEFISEDGTPTTYVFPLHPSETPK